MIPVDHIRKLLLGLFKEFNAHHIDYCILRNYEFIVDDSFDYDKDIDILVSQSDIKKASIIIQAAGFFTGTSTGELKHATFIYYAYPDIILALDVKIGDMHWNDITYFPGKIILERKQEYNGFYIPDNECTVVALLLHSILDKKYFKPNYVEIIENLLDNDQVELSSIKSIVNNLYSHRIQKKIRSLLIDKSYDQLLSMRMQLIIKRILKHPLDLFLLIRNLIYRKIIKKLARIWQKAPFFSILGPDGSGKSTVLQTVSNHLQNLGYTTKIIYMGRWREHVLPLASVAQNIQTNSNSTVTARTTQENQANPRRLYLLVRELVYILEYYLRYWLRIFPLRKKRVIALTDRYAYDLALDSQVVFNPMTIFGHFYPKPTTVFYLYNTADEMYKRKSEQSVSELNVQLSQYSEMAGKLKWFSIKNDQLDNTISTIMQQILKSLAR